MGTINDALGSVHQLQYFPDTTTSATLSFWMNITSTEPSNGDYDLFDVNLRTSADVLIQKLATYSEANRGATGVYQKVTIDLTPYLSQLRGQYRRTRYGDKEQPANELIFQVLFTIGAHGAHPF